jgi:hypothetical protein
MSNLRIIFVAVIAGFVLGVGNAAEAANFNALTAGASYAVGEEFMDGGLQFEVVMGPYSTSAANATVGTVGTFIANPSFAGNFLNFPFNVGVAVDLPIGATEIGFDFYHGHPNGQLLINGSPLAFTSIPATVNGVIVTHILGAQPPANRWGSIRAVGNIESFAVMGVELWIDNFAVHVPGDHNLDQVVDAADYVLWRKHDNTSSGYNAWRGNFGRSPVVGSALFNSDRPVPEPSLAAIVVGTAILAAQRRKRIA